MKRLSFFVLSMLFAVWMAGCSGKPSGMPDCVPCKVLVQKNGQALEGVRITLHRDGESGSIGTTGLTNSAGSARITTQFVDFKSDGAPVGRYKVTLNRILPKPSDMSDADWQKQTGSGKADDPNIPPHLRIAKTTQLTFDVQNPDDEMKIELNDHVKTLKK